MGPPGAKPASRLYRLHNLSAARRPEKKHSKEPLPSKIHCLLGVKLHFLKMQLLASIACKAKLGTQHLQALLSPHPGLACHRLVFYFFLSAYRFKTRRAEANDVACSEGILQERQAKVRFEKGGCKKPVALNRKANAARGIYLQPLCREQKSENRVNPTPILSMWDPSELDPWNSQQSQKQNQVIQLQSKKSSQGALQATDYPEDAVCKEMPMCSSANPLDPCWIAEVCHISSHIVDETVDLRPKKGQI